MEQINNFIGRLGDKSKRIRRNAEKELVMMGCQAVGPLIDALEDENWRVRWRAVNALGKIGDPSAINPLIKSFSDCLSIQIIAAIALRNIGKPVVVGPLICALEDSGWEIREGAAMALGKTGDKTAVEPLIRSLSDDCASVRQRAVIALGEIGDHSAVLPLIDAFKDEDFLVRWHSSSALGKIGEAAEEPLLQALRDVDREARYWAIRALHRVKSIRAVKLLIGALEDEIMKIRLSATAALGDIGDSRATHPLIKALKDDYMAVRLHAAEALGKLGDLSAIEPLLGILGDNRYAVREAAAISLNKLREPIIGPILRKLNAESGFVHDGRVLTRERKCFSFALEPLIQALYKGNTATRLAASVALGMIGGPRPVEPLTYAVNNDKDKDVRMAAVQSLGKIGGGRAKKVLRCALSDTSPEVCSKALGALTFLRDTSAVEPLLKALRDEDKEVRQSVAEDMGYIGGGNRKAERMIRTALANIEEDIREEATHALEAMEEEKERETAYTESWEA